MRSLREIALIWVVCTLGLASLTFFLLLFVQSLPFELYSWACLLFFAISSMAMFFILYFAKVNNKHIDTTKIVFVLVGFRMLLSLGFLVVWFAIMGPADRYYIVPFLVFYLVYKVFEVFYLSKYSNYLDKRIEQKII